MAGRDAPRDETPDDAENHEPTIERRTFAEGRLRMGLAGGGAFRWALADLSDVVETARGRLDLSPVASAALGRLMAASALLLRMVAKTPVRLTLDVQGDGPIGRVIAQADADGHLRGLVGHPRVEVPDLPNGKLAVGRAVGAGYLRVLREHRRGTYHSQVALVTGEIGDDVAHFLEQSEQSSSAVLVGVLGRQEGVAAAGGMVLERLPGVADEEATRALEANLAAIPGISWLMEEGGMDRVLEAVLSGFDLELAEERPLFYSCRCSRERLHRHLAAVPPEQLAEYQLTDGTIEGECVFCGHKYHFLPEDLQPPS